MQKFSAAERELRRHEFLYLIARPENNAKKAVLQSANCKEQI